MIMARRGLLVDYRWCTGCHSCEIACQMEHGLPVGQYGIKVCEIGPWRYGEDDWQYTYLPIITDQCNFCAERLGKGKTPSCVKHCQSQCLRFAPADDVASDLAVKQKQLFITL
jgi:anaerobic dimethyl sulfoxide reductase subunit B (iron-sulfur subunit)